VIDLRAIATGLEPGPDGLWHPRSRSRVDYPDEGNAFCYQIEDQSFWFRYRNLYILDAVRRFPPAGVVFDVGGGNGFVARALVHAGFPAIVVEPGSAGAHNALSRGLSPVVCAALDDAGFVPESMPAVGLFDVLEHMADDRGVLGTVASLLQPGGRLYLTVPAYQWLWSGEDELSGHHRRYTLRVLGRAIEDAGLEIVYRTYLFWPLPLPILLLRAIPTRLGFRPAVDPDAIRRELQPREGLAVRALTTLLDAEIWWLRRGRRVPFGGSCLIVAGKPGPARTSG
jgi:SAM-dependent methyltransferase